MTCDDGIIPLQDRIDVVGYNVYQREIYYTDCRFLCVACTRTRNHLILTGVDSDSEFLDDLVRRNAGRDNS